jgi:hypothetical protein
MNKIERAIYDTKLHIESLRKDRMILIAEINAYEKQLEVLESIERNKSIPHQENIPAFNLQSSNYEPDEVPYASICSCNPINGGSGLCGCIMGNKMVPNPRKYPAKTNFGTTTTDTARIDLDSLDSNFTNS